MKKISIHINWKTEHNDFKLIGKLPSDITLELKVPEDDTEDYLKTLDYMEIVEKMFGFEPESVQAKIVCWANEGLRLS